MAETVINTNMREMAWGKQTWMEAQEEMFFNPFIGGDEPIVPKAEAAAFNNIIVKKTDLAKGEGDRIQIRLLMQLTGGGVTGDNTLEGNEEALSYFYQNLTVNQLRHAVKIKGKMEEQKTRLTMRKDAKSALKMWWANTLDTDIMTVLAASPTSSAVVADNRVIYGGDATSVGTLEQTDVLTPTLVTKAKIQARLSNPRIRPIKYKGKEYFVMLVHDYNMNDLKQDDDINAALRNAWNKGEKNPLFSGADFEWDGVLFWSYNKVSTAATGGTGGDVNYSQPLLLGAQAGVFAVGNAGGEGKKVEMDWVEEGFDYKNKYGVSGGMIYEAGKSLFDSKDYGVISVYCAHTALL